jgi:hypothetical protein
MQLTENEKEIISIIRELKPFEVVEIKKDREGKPDYYLVKREQKIILTTIIVK